MSDYGDGLAVLKNRARAAAANEPTPAAPANDGPSVIGRFAAIFGAGLAVMLGWATGGHVSSAIQKRRRARPLLLDQHGRPIGGKR